MDISKKFKEVVMVKEKEGKVDISKRKFIKKAVAALGVIAASAGVSNILVSASSNTINRKRTNMNYTNDDLQQERVLSQKQCVLMTDEEKKQMLNEILNNYHKELA